MEPFASLSYREIIRGTLEQKRRDFRKHYTMENLAKHCEISSVYLSRALSGKASLTSEQLAFACDFLAMNDDEYKYVDLVHQLDLTKHPKKKKLLEKEITKLRQKALSTKEFISTGSAKISTPNHQMLFLDPMLQIILMFMSINRFAEDPVKICSLLSLSDDEVIRHIKFLEQEGYIVRKNDTYFTTRRTLHIDPENDLYPPYRELMALQALRSYPKVKDPYKYNLNAIFSADEDARQQIKKMLLELVKAGQVTSQASSKDNVYQLNLQLFSWSHCE